MNKNEHLSVVILTKNEEKNILDCLECVIDVDDILIIDDFSEDRSLDIVKQVDKGNIKIFRRHLDNDFSKQRNFGLSKANSEWVMFLDADERASEGLMEEVFETIQLQTQNVRSLPAGRQGKKLRGFYIRRLDNIGGKILKHGETGNTKLLRLARKNAGKWEGAVHESWIVEGKVGSLNNSIYHYPHQTIREFLQEINYYSTIRAGELFKKNIDVSFIDILLYPKAKFFLNYFIKLGFMDGIAGLIVALMMSFHSFLVRGKLWLLQNNER